MSGTFAKVKQAGHIELVAENLSPIAGADKMTTMQGAELARSLLACSAILTFEPSPKEDVVPADVHLPVAKCQVGTRPGTRIPIIVFSVPPGVDLTFQLSPEGAKELGEMLIACADMGSAAPN